MWCESLKQVFRQPTLNWVTVTQLREHSQKKKRLSFGQCPKGGGGATGIQKFWGTFFSPYFDQLLDIKWGEGGGLTMFQKFWGTFLSKYWEFWALKKLPHGCPKWADTKVTSRVSKMGGGGQGHFWTRSKRRTLFFLMASLSGKGIVLAIRAKYYIYSDGKCPC